MGHEKEANNIESVVQDIKIVLRNGMKVFKAVIIHNRIADVGI